MTRAVLFDTSTCRWCSSARSYLKDKGMPVIKIGSEWIVGFDRQRIDRALATRRS